MIHQLRLLLTMDINEERTIEPTVPTEDKAVEESNVAVSPMAESVERVPNEQPPQSQTKPKSKSFPTKFKLTPDLKNGSVSLARDERIIETWAFESTSMSFAEWCATFISFGIYYFMTRIILQRKRTYCVMVTNLNIIVKEEMMETSWGCMKLLLENQASFPISSLSFVTSEVVGQKLCGLFPASVALEMRFGRYPVDSELPKTTYR